MHVQKFKDCIIHPSGDETSFEILFNREISLRGFRYIDQSNFLIFKEYLIERETFVQSILFLLLGNRIERSLMNLLLYKFKKDRIISIKSYKSTHLCVFQLRLNDQTSSSLRILRWFLVSWNAKLIPIKKVHLLKNNFTILYQNTVLFIETQ